MRNLKRALSLTLASVMLLGMMVVGSSAAAGYDDVAETDNVEAIEVLQAVQVMVGDERGFGPERPVNRAEMAVVMGKLLNLDYNYYEAICPFNDVYDWARGWVGACYANGIVSGRGEGVYDPGTTVTAVEAASMLMRALGYFKYQSDYSAGFETATVLQANKIRLFDGVDSTVNAPLTRNQVAQMALNALKTGMVEPDGNTLNFIDTNGNIIASGGKVNYVNVTSNKAFATAINDVRASSMGSANDAPIVELGEQLYNGKLKLTDTTDAFGRPARYWEYDAKAIGTYVKEELIREEYTVKVTGRTLHDLLGSTTIKDYDLDVYVDGVSDPAANTAVFGKSSLVRTNDVGVGATGKGVLTQVFVDPDEGANGLITIAIINTYLAIADEDFDDRTDDVDVTVYGIDPIPGYRNEYYKTASIGTNDGAKGPTNESSPFKLELEDFPEIKDMKDGDATLVTVAQGEVQTLSKPEILSSAQISTFKQGSYVISGGTQYDFASAAEFEMNTLYDYTATDNAVVNLKDISYNIYLDKYGYAIGVEEVERVNNYMFITGVDTNTNNRYAVQADASAIFLDGTMEAIKIDMKAVRDLSTKDTYNALTGVTNDGVKGGSLVNQWFTYTVGDDGLYEVVLVGDYSAVENNKARAGQFRTLNTADNSIYALDADGKLTDTIIALGKNQGVDEISRKSIALRGANTARTTYYSVYGDDKSVYITAELSTIQDAHENKKMVNVIGGVDNVAVGIDEASIDIWTKTQALAADDGANKAAPAEAAAYGAYVLYDDDGDIIAAVVVGEDSGSVTNLVYTHENKIESETDNNASGSSTKANSVKGDYTWTRKVISNGEEITLTEVGSGLSKLKGMKDHTWYVVKYNAKGEVKNVYPAWDIDKYKGLISADAKNEKNDVKRLEDQYVNDIEELNTATNENSLVLYEVGQWNTLTNDLRVGSINILKTKPSVDNHTFYVKNDTNTGVHQGFRVADDVKTVFIQYNNNDWTTTYESGYSRLEKVVDRLHDHDEKGNWGGESNLYHYELSAVMENGKAVVVVIRDRNNAGANIGPVTGKYTVKFQPGFWSDERNVFYVGVNKLDENDITNYNANLDSFRVPANGSVQVVRKNATDERYDEDVRGMDGYNRAMIIGEYDNKALGYVIGTVNNTGRVLDFTVWGDCTLYRPTYFALPATLTPKSTVAGFTPNDAGEKIFITDSVYEMVIRSTLTGEDDLKFVAGSTYTVTVKVQGVSGVQTFDVACERNGIVSVDVKVPTNLYQGDNIDVTVTDVKLYKAGDPKPPVVEDKDVSVTFAGNAKQGDNYTVSGLVDGKIPAGGKLTIVGNPNVVVHCDKGAKAEGVTGTEVKAGPGVYKEWTVTPDGTETTINIVVNKTKLGVIQDVDGGFGLGTVEDTSEPAGMQMARIAVRTDAPEIDGEWLKFSFTDLNGNKQTMVACLYTKPSGVTAYWFGKDATREALEALVAASEAGAFNPEIDPNGPSQEDKDKYNGKDDPKPPTPDNKTWTLTLANYLAENPDGIEVWVDARTGEQELVEPYVSTSGNHELEYKIPKGAKVFLHDANANWAHFDTPAAGTSTVAGDKPYGYKVGNDTYMEVSRVWAFNGAASAAQLEFEMNEDLTLDLIAKNTFANGYPAYPVTVHDGVKVTLEYTDRDKETQTKVLEGEGDHFFVPYTYKDESEKLPTNVSEMIKFTINKTGAEVRGTSTEGKYVSAAIVSASGWAKDFEVTGFSLREPLNLYSTTKVSTTQVEFETSEGLAKADARTNYVHYGEDLTLSHAYLSAEGAKAADDAFINLTKDQITRAYFAKEAGDPNVITDGVFAVGSEDANLYGTVKFTLGKGVKATLCQYDSDQTQGTAGATAFPAIGDDSGYAAVGMDKAQIISATTTADRTFYMASMEKHTGNTPGQPVVGTGKVVGLAALRFEAIDKVNHAVVDPAKADYEKCKYDGVYEWATHLNTFASETFNGGRWEAWTKVVAGDNRIDEAYIMRGDREPGLVFNDLYEIGSKALRDALEKDAFTYARAFKEEAKTFYIDPDVGERISIITGSGNPDNEMLVANDEPLMETPHDWYEEQEHNKHLCGDIIVGTEKIELKVVAKP